MADSAPPALPQVEVPPGHLFVGQPQHLLLLLVLLPGAWALAGPALDGGDFLGLSTRDWFVASVGVAVVHQVIVAFGFRAQLCYGIFTRLFGRRDMLVWALLFFPFLIARPLTILGLAIADAGSLALPRPIALLAGVALLALSGYTLWSVKRYFGFARAMGGDHFRERYRQMPIVREGAFRWSSNAMYGLAFLGLWGIALVAGSRAALAAALFTHAYIWVHMYCTEEPDLRVLYGSEAP